MAVIDNPRKEFNFSMQVIGFPINPFLFQELTLPDHSIDQSTHGDTNYDVKTGGRVKVGELEIEKIMTTAGADNYFWNWMAAVQDTYLGGGNVPAIYKRGVIIQELAEDGTSVINSWVFEGCFPIKINGQKFTRKGSDNSIERISLSVDRPEKI